MERRIIMTGDGSHSIFVPQLGDHYHSVHGSLTESRHIFIENGFRRVGSSGASILEIGFGTGLNALLTLVESKATGTTVYYEAWEKYPLTREEARSLNYGELVCAGEDYFQQLHDAPWETETRILNHFALLKRNGDIRDLSSSIHFNLVYFDAFGPDFQPELWEPEIFRKIHTVMSASSWLVTYSAKGQVRRNMRQAGFEVVKVPGPPHKREITVACKPN